MEKSALRSQQILHGLLQAFIAFHFLGMASKPMDNTRRFLEIMILLFVSIAFVSLPKLWPDWAKAGLFSCVFAGFTGNVLWLFMNPSRDDRNFEMLLLNPFPMSVRLAMVVGFVLGLGLCAIRMRFSGKQFWEFLTYSGPPRELPKAED